MKSFYNKPQMKFQSMERKIFFAFILTLGFFNIQAQTAFDALRYSNLTFSGTARSLGAGGALGALGADFSVLSTNPAGLATYRRSEFSLTPSLLVTATDAQLRTGSNTPLESDDQGDFNLSNVGFVFANRPNSSKWKTANFGIGLNRVANFSQSFFYQGTSPGSIMTRWKDFANSGEGISDFEEGLAIDAGGLFQFDGDDFYYSDFDGLETEEVTREETVITDGSINELVFSFAGNYEEKLMIGATIGVPFLTFTEEKIYVESDREGNRIPLFNSLDYRQDLNTTGVGINLKLGFIYRVNQMLRLGGAVHTPTRFGLDDSFSSSLNYDYTTDEGETSDITAESPDGLFDYRLVTPWRLMGNVGIIIGKKGFLSGEIEWVDYGSASFNYGQFGDSEREVNREIENTLTQAINLKLGGELVLDIFQLRAGFQILNSPLENDETVNYAYSLGAGLRQRSFFLDIAYRRSLLEETYVPYTVDQAPIQYVDNDITYGNFLLTLGFKF